MSEYQLKRKISDLESKVNEFERQASARMRIYTEIGDRLGMLPQVVEVLIQDGLGSDHEGLQKQVTDFLMMVKLIHPENAHQVTQDIKDRAEAAKKAAEDRRRAAAAYQKKMVKAEQAIEDAYNANLVAVQNVVDALYKKISIADGYSFDALTYEEQQLCSVLSNSNDEHQNGKCYVRRCGFLWCKVKWFGEKLTIDDKHPVYKYLQKHRPSMFVEIPKSNFNLGYSHYHYFYDEMDF